MKTHLLFLAFLCLFFAACSSGNSPADQELKEVMFEGAKMAPPPPPAVPTVRFTPPVIANDEDVRYEEETQTREPEEIDPAGGVPTQKLIRTGSIEIEANTLAESKSYIDRQLQSAGGYYENEAFENSSNETVYNLKARIPAAAFERFLKALDGAGGTLRNRNIAVANVTAEYVDVESRLTTKRTYMARYKELVNKADKMTDLLAIEENIRTLQEEIESTESQLRVLKDQVGYSTLSIKLYTLKPYVITGDSFGTQIRNAFATSGEKAKDFLLWLVENWMVLLILLAGGLWLRRRWIRRQR